MNIILSLLKFVQKTTFFILFTLLQHITTLFNQFCVVQEGTLFKDDPKGRAKKAKRHFGVAFALYLWATLDGVVLLHCEAVDFHFSLLAFKNLSSSPYLVFRQMYPPSMWPQSDVILSTAFALQLLILGHFILAEPLEEQGMVTFRKVHSQGSFRLTGFINRKGWNCVNC